jgi:hypothetical protein
MRAATHRDNADCALYQWQPATRTGCCTKIDSGPHTRSTACQICKFRPALQSKNCFRSVLKLKLHLSSAQSLHLQEAWPDDEFFSHVINALTSIAALAKCILCLVICEAVVSAFHCTSFNFKNVAIQAAQPSLVQTPDPDLQTSGSGRPTTRRRSLTRAHISP